MSTGEHSHLLGKPVEVTLSFDGSGDGPVIAKGALLSYSAMGEVILQGDDGDVHYCWPLLDIREANRDHATRLAVECSKVLRRVVGHPPQRDEPG